MYSYYKSSMKLGNIWGIGGCIGIVEKNMEAMFRVLGLMSRVAALESHIGRISGRAATT